MAEEEVNLAKVLTERIWQRKHLAELMERPNQMARLRALFEIRDPLQPQGGLVNINGGSTDLARELLRLYPPNLHGTPLSNLWNIAKHGLIGAPDTHELQGTNVVAMDMPGVGRKRTSGGIFTTGSPRRAYQYSTRYGNEAEGGAIGLKGYSPRSTSEMVWRAANRGKFGTDAQFYVKVQNETQGVTNPAEIVVDPEFQGDIRARHRRDEILYWMRARKDDPQRFERGRLLVRKLEAEAGMKRTAAEKEHVRLLNKTERIGAILRIPGLRFEHLTEPGQARAEMEAQENVRNYSLGRRSREIQEESIGGQKMPVYERIVTPNLKGRYQGINRMAGHLLRFKRIPPEALEVAFARYGKPGDSRLKVGKFRPLREVVKRKGIGRVLMALGEMVKRA